MGQQNIRGQIVSTGNITLTWSDEGDRRDTLLGVSHRAGEISRIWEREQAKRPVGKKFTNGRPYFVLGVEKEGDGVVIKGVFGEYKQWLAQHVELHDLGINPIGISGLIVTSDRKVVFGRRSHSVTQYPGFYELLPSGGIDIGTARSDHTVDYRKKVVAEFCEETGLADRCITTVQSFALLLGDDGVYDVGCLIMLDIPATQVEAAFARSSDEYATLTMVHTDELRDFIKQHKMEMVPGTPILVDLFLETRG